MIRRAKKDGLDITADVSAHQLHLTELDISSFNSACHVLPPLRSKRDQEALITAVADGTIDAVCSDHQPHEADAKEAPFAATQPGISSLETLLPLVLRLVEQGSLDMNTAIRAITANPASILGIKSGTLAVGTTADLCLINRQANWQLDDTGLLSRGKNSPFIGWSFQGQVQHTVIGGVLLHSQTRQALKQ